MNYSKIFQHVLTEVIVQLSNLSNKDFEKINDGTYEISINVKKNRSPSMVTSVSSAAKNQAIADKLHLCKSREEGIDVLSSNFKNMKDLEQFAKSLDVLVLKQDKIDHVREKIVEATIGAVLRSHVIQGKNTYKEKRH